MKNIQEVIILPIPCRARCKNERNGFCQLNEEELRQNQVEFASELDPSARCSCFVPREGESKKINNKVK